MVMSCLSLVSLYSRYLRRSFILAGLSPQTVDVDSETTIHFWGPETESSPTPKGKPALLLLHGFGPSAVFQWRHQVQSLTPQFDLYIPDLIFFGGSTTTSKSSERSEILQVVSMGKLVEKLGLERFSVVGTSYGGFVAYHMALKWPEKVDKVVIASSAVSMRKKDKEELLKRAKVEKIEYLMLPTTPGQLRTLIRLSMFKPPLILPDFLLNGFLHKLLENREEKIELLKGLTLGQNETTNVSPLQQDVLIVWGDHDQIFPLEKAFELKEYAS
uniref:AB hydrolase-1 domain-containing protein n=1 Tax=Nelumbo nucifera TaxID=4432 RepID=A0A823A1K0_NELNU|nr:TPA_asm: hypothetical protein HUJ06_019116 [Nelumbo nucifera]